MDFYFSTLYGIVQGLTEFLPVSSSAHLALLPYFFTVEDPGVTFDLAMHVGTALAVFCYFRRDVYVLTIELLALLGKKPSVYGRRNYCVNFIITTVVSVLFAFVLKDYAPQFGRNPQVIAFNLCFFGILMLLADYFMSESEHLVMSEKYQWSKSLLIGIFQAIALFPGVSRSGATLTIARFLKLGRDEAAAYSFLLSLPLIFGGFILKLAEFTESSGHGGWSVALWGMFVSFLVGLLAIHFFLKFIKKMGLWIFSLYRIALAIGILMLS